jgi:hypothetical protein
LGGFGYVWHCTSDIHENKFLYEVKQRLLDVFIQERNTCNSFDISPNSLVNIQKYLYKIATKGCIAFYYSVPSLYCHSIYRHPRIPPLQDAEPISTHVKKTVITPPSLIAIRQAILGTKC